MRIKSAHEACKCDSPIAARYTCEGADISPELQWSGEPPKTRSFSLIVDDPDAPDPRAPKMTWVHWVVYNIPADVHGLYALDTILPDLGHPTKAQLLSAMKGHVLAEAQLIGTYAKQH